MARIKTRRKAETQELNAPTAERFAHAQRFADAHSVKQAHTTVSVVDLSGRSNKRIDKTPRFTPRLDLLYAHSAISAAQFVAGCWWRERVELSQRGPRLCSDYGQSTGRGTPDYSPLPTSDKAEKAWRELAAAKARLSLNDRQAIEDVLSDPHEPLTGRASVARMNGWRKGLRALAVFLGSKAC